MRTQKILFVMMFLLFSTELFPVCEAKDISNREKARVLSKQATMLLGQLSGKTDSTEYFQLVSDVIKTSLLCDYYDSKPDRKGRVVPKFRKANSKRILDLRPVLLEGGMYHYANRNNRQALECFTLYMDVSINSMFASEPDSEKGKVAYYAALLAYGEGNYRDADRYADEALKDNFYAKDAAEVKVLCMRQTAKTKADSARYLVALLELHDMAPQNQTYFKMLMEYFASPGHEHEMGLFANDEIKKDSTNKFAWALKGESDMREQRWNEAIAAYGKAAAIDTTFVEAIFNIGICYCGLAQETKNVDDARNGMLFLEKTAGLDPNCYSVDWREPLAKVKAAIESHEEKTLMAEAKKKNSVKNASRSRSKTKTRKGSKAKRRKR